MSRRKVSANTYGRLAAETDEAGRRSRRAEGAGNRPY